MSHEQISRLVAVQANSSFHSVDRKQRFGLFARSHEEVNESQTEAAGHARARISDPFVEKIEVRPDMGRSAHNAA
jgi:hypothetical protein